MERTCKECGKTMPLEMFPKRGGYYLHSCKECTNAKKRAWCKNRERSDVISYLAVRIADSLVRELRKEETK